VRAVEIWRLRPEPALVAGVDGDLLEEYLRRRKDLGTNWLGRMLAALLENTSARGSAAFNVIDDSGSFRAVYAKGFIGASIMNSTYSYDSGCHVGIGTGRTAPSRGDYRLQSEIARAPASARYTDGSDYVIVSAVFILGAGASVSEVGLYWRDGYNGWLFLLDRTVLPSPVAFPAGTPMLVAYKIAI